MVFDPNVMEDVIWISMDVAFFVDVSHASHVKEACGERWNRGNGIAVSIDGKGERKGLIKLPLQMFLEGSRLTKGVKDQIIGRNAILFVKTKDGDRSHRSSQ